MGLTLACPPASLILGLLSILLRLTTKIEWEKLPPSTIWTDGNIQRRPIHHNAKQQIDHRTGNFFQEISILVQEKHLTQYF